jgi:hypothetical protein
MKHKLSLHWTHHLRDDLTHQRGRAQTVAPGPYYAKPSWDQKLDCTTPANCPRFVVLELRPHAAVLDRETGLVWERSPLALAGTYFCSHQIRDADLGCRSSSLQHRTNCRQSRRMAASTLQNCEPSWTMIRQF